jgi:hypothetical protein
MRRSVRDALILAIVLGVPIAIIERMPDGHPVGTPGYLSGQTGCFDWRTVRLYTDEKGFTTITGLVVPCNDPRAHAPKPIEIL